MPFACQKLSGVVCHRWANEFEGGMPVPQGCPAARSVPKHGGDEGMKSIRWERGGTGSQDGSGTGEGTHAGRACRHDEKGRRNLQLYQGLLGDCTRDLRGKPRHDPKAVLYVQSHLNWLKTELSSSPGSRIHRYLSAGKVSPLCFV